MATCPNCQSQVSETAKFCSECGVGLIPGARDAAWIAATQEKIKRAKENDLFYTIFGVFGAAVAISIPLVISYVLRFRMDLVTWLLTTAGILFFIGGYLGTWYNNRKVKELIKLLENEQE